MMDSGFHLQAQVLGASGLGMPVGGSIQRWAWSLGILCLDKESALEVSMLNIKSYSLYHSFSQQLLTLHYCSHGVCPSHVAGT